MDFGSGSYSVTFTAGVTTNSFDVPITDDTIVECDDETFDLTIQSTSLPNRVNVTNPSQATITIIDTTSKSEQCTKGISYKSLIPNDITLFGSLLYF